MVRLLQHQKSLLAGQYHAAGELLEAMEKNLPPLSALMAEFANNKIEPTGLLLAEFARFTPPGAALLPATAFQVAQTERGGRAVEAREIIATRLQQESRFFYRRGALLLLEGDTRGAKQRFQQATRTPPAGWALSDFHTAEADNYLRLIEEAEKKSAAP
jgi:hypothetical protein